MSDLLARLKLLGVAGPEAAADARPVPAPTAAAAPAAAPAAAGVVLPEGAQTLHTPSGALPFWQARLPLAAAGGAPAALPAALGRYYRDARIAALPPERLAFLDTETTGLAGGSGTLAFLLGVGRFERDAFVVRQFLLPDPALEPALLDALELLLAPAAALVSYNGRSFDVPLLRLRLDFHRRDGRPLARPHLDLLHPVRRLWGAQLPNCTLAEVERRVLQRPRAPDDVPGERIPELYFEFLRSRDATPLEGVLHHNRADVTALAALLARLGGHLARPTPDGDPRDALARARFFEHVDEVERAERAYAALLEGEAQRPPASGTARAEARWRLAALRKRRGDPEGAVPLWRHLADGGHLPACVELAKHHEHRRRDAREALRWTQRALALCADADGDTDADVDARAALEHRAGRLRRRLERLRGVPRDEGR